MTSQPLSKLATIFSLISISSGKLVSWLTIGMVTILTINVLSSWWFKTSWIILSESVTWMHCANFLLAAAYTLNRNEHVRVDIFYAKMSEKRKALVDLLGTLLFLIPLSVFIFWASWSYVALSWKFNEASAEAGGMPAIYLLKGMLLLMPVLLLIEGINQLIVNSNKLRYPSSNSPSNIEETE